MQRETTQLAAGEDAKALQLPAETSAYAAQLLDRHLFQNGRNLFRTEMGQAIRLVLLRGQLGKQLVRCNADRAGDAETGLDARLDQVGNPLNTTEQLQGAA